MSNVVNQNVESSFVQLKVGEFSKDSSDIQCLQKVFTPLDFCHILLCYSLNLKWIKFNFFVADLHKITHNDKVKTCFEKFLQINVKLKAEMYCVNKYYFAERNTL